MGGVPEEIGIPWSGVEGRRGVQPCRLRSGGGLFHEIVGGAG